MPRRHLMVGLLGFLASAIGQPMLAIGTVVPPTPASTIIAQGTGHGQAEAITAPGVAGLQAHVVGHYMDDTGRQQLPYNGAYIDDPVSADYNRRYVVGHDVARIFQPLHGLVVGDIVYDRWAGYGDGTGRYDHTTVLRVVGVHHWWPNSDGVPPITPGADTQFQTCEDGTSYYDRIIDLQLLRIQ